MGDTDTDMQTAVAAGMFPVGALWGFRTAGELTANGAQALAERPIDLLVMIDGRLEELPQHRASARSPSSSLQPLRIEPTSSKLGI